MGNGKKKIIRIANCNEGDDVRKETEQPVMRENIHRKVEKKNREREKNRRWGVKDDRKKR